MNDDLVKSLAERRAVEQIAARILPADDISDLSQMVYVRLLTTRLVDVADMDAYIARIIINLTNEGGEYYRLFTEYTLRHDYLAEASKTRR